MNIVSPASPAIGQARRAYGRGLICGKARVAVFERFGYACVKCGKQFEPRDATGRFAPVDRSYVDHRGRAKVCMLEVDHIIPRHRGGTNDPANLQALCTQCNSRKGARV